jgi:hypothetical protein
LLLLPLLRTLLPLALSKAELRLLNLLLSNSAQSRPCFIGKLKPQPLILQVRNTLGENSAFQPNCSSVVTVDYEVKLQMIPDYRN